MATAQPAEIDTRPEASVFSPPPGLPAVPIGKHSEERFHDPLDRAGSSLQAGPIRSPGRFVQGSPIQLAKVQRPPLRAATLRRHRLNRWLNEHAGRRVVLVSAEAGYGKTTLLADWTRQAGVRVLWYRIDEEDSNWCKCWVCMPNPAHRKGSQSGGYSR
jgi:hypothetical protein